MIFVMNLLNPPTLFLLLNIFKVEEIMNLYGFIVYHFYDLITLQGILQKKKSFDIYRYIYIYAQIQSFNQNFIHFKMP